MGGKDITNILIFDNISAKKRKKTHIYVVKPNFTNKNHTKIK
jgi:hypothetical protein